MWESKVERKKDPKGNVKTYITDTMTDKSGQTRTRKRQKHVLPGASNAEVLQRFKGVDESEWKEAWDKGGIEDRMEVGTKLLSQAEVPPEAPEAPEAPDAPEVAKLSKRSLKAGHALKRVMVEDASDDEDDTSDSGSISSSSSASASASMSSLSCSRKNKTLGDWMMPVMGSE